MKNGPLEDVFPIEHADIPGSYVSSPEGNSFGYIHKIYIYTYTWWASGCPAMVPFFRPISQTCRFSTTRTWKTSRIWPSSPGLLLFFGGKPNRKRCCYLHVCCFSFCSLQARKWKKWRNETKLLCALVLCNSRLYTTSCCKSCCLIDVETIRHHIFDVFWFLSFWDISPCHHDNVPICFHGSKDVFPDQMSMWFWWPFFVPSISWMIAIP